MSFGICRVQKIKGAAGVVGLQLHNRREREHSNSNPDIDRSRSGLNYSLIDEQSINYNRLIDERLKQAYKGKKAIRKDAVKMCEMLFTSDGDFFSRISEQEQRQFFLDCFEFAAQRYGRENIIAATVHLDEATPHLHLDFVPLTPDGRLSAKEVLGNRPQLQQLQDDFFSAVSTKYGLERGQRADIESRERPRKHLETAEFKEKLARDRTKQAEQAEQSASQRIQAAKQKAAQAEQFAADQQQKAEKHQRKRKELKAQRQEEQAELDRLIQQKNDIQKEIDTKKAELQRQQNELQNQKDSLTAQIGEQQRQLNYLQQQITDAQQELTYRQHILDKITTSPDGRYCYFTVSPQILDKMPLTSSEFKFIFDATQREDGMVVLQAPSSERTYLSAAVAKAQVLVKNENQPPRNPPRMRR